MIFEAVLSSAQGKFDGGHLGEESEERRAFIMLGIIWLLFYLRWLIVGGDWSLP